MRGRWRLEAAGARRTGLGVSPWRRLADATGEELHAVLASARRLMRASLEGERAARRVYRRTGRPCARCGAPIRARGQGDANRTAYWCPGCQR
jgi:endonuclease-8